MSNPLTKFIDTVVGDPDAEEVWMGGDFGDDVAVAYDRGAEDIPGALLRTDMEVVEQTSNGRTEYVQLSTPTPEQDAPSDEEFFSSPTNLLGSPDPVDFERQQPTGKYAPADTEPDPTVPTDRAPDGTFVSPDREPIEDFGRDSDDGVFDRIDPL